MATAPNCRSLLQQGGLTLSSFRQQCPGTFCPRPTRSRAHESRRRPGVFDASACKKVFRCRRHRYQQQQYDQDPLPHGCDVHLDTILTEYQNVMRMRRWSDDELFDIARETESAACMRCHCVVCKSTSAPWKNKRANFEFQRDGCAIDHKTPTLIRCIRLRLDA